MTLENLDIRKLVAEQQIPYWRLAEKIGISPEYLSKCLRHPLKQEMKSRILEAIDGIKRGSQSA